MIRQLQRLQVFLYHSSFTSALFRTASFQTFTIKTPGFQFTRHHGADKKCENHQPFSRLSLISLFQDYFSIQSFTSPFQDYIVSNLHHKTTGLSVHPLPWNWQKVQNHQLFSRLSVSVFFKTILQFNHSPVLLRTTFPYVSFLEKRPGFKFTRYHGTDDWSSSSQVIPLDRKVSLQPGFKPSISRLA